MSRELNYKTIGSGPPVIILHGLFGMLDNWISFAKKLSKNFTVYIIDQRNHGKSFHSDVFDYTVLAEDLDHFIVDHDLSGVSVIGHSMGGKTAMQYAIDHPGKLSHLIVVDIAPKINEAKHMEIFHAIFSLELSTFSTRKEVEDSLGINIKDKSILQFLLKNLARNKDGSYAWKANFKALYANYPAILDNIDHGYQTVDTPTLFIRGTRSPYISDDDMDSIKSIFANVHRVDMDAGHWIHAEKPDELLQTIKRFLHYSVDEFVT